MSRYMLESDLPQYLNDKFYVVRDHEGKLLGVLPDTFDAYDMIECVEEIPPEKEPEPDNGLGYGPSTQRWSGIPYGFPGATTYTEASTWENWLRERVLSSEGGPTHQLIAPEPETPSLFNYLNSCGDDQ